MSDNTVDKSIDGTSVLEEKQYKLCENMDCERFPPDWDDEEDTEDTYQEGQWKKCCLCDGYFDDDGMGDILFVQEEPNNQEASCDLCGKENNIVQMKGSGQYLCEAACDEDEEDEEDEDEEEENKEDEDEEEENKETEKESKNLIEYHVITTMYGGFDTGYCFAGEREYENEEEALKYYNEISLVTLNESKYTGGVQYKRIESGKAHKLENGEYETVYLNENKEETVNEDDEESEDEVDEDDKKTGTCDICCRDKSFENYYVFKRGRKQELFSCVKCWEDRKTQLVGESWTWTSHTYPGPAFYTVEVDEEKEENNKCDGCNIKLNRIRDGSTDNYIRCNNCYWEDKEGKDSINIIKPDYRKNKEEDESESEDNKEGETMYNDWLIQRKNHINGSNTYKLPCRKHLSNMMLSHMLMVLPCIWWIYIDRPETEYAVLYSKLMSMIMIVAIVASYLYHYYNECVLCSAETEYNKFAIICLNIYMYLRNVSIFYILPGFIILYGLHKSLEYCNSQNNKDIYELYHPFCHYIAGLYIYYCVWNLNNAQQKICDTTPNNIIYNDISSGVNYPEIRL